MGIGKADISKKERIFERYLCIGKVLAKKIRILRVKKNNDLID